MNIHVQTKYDLGDEIKIILADRENESFVVTIKSIQVVANKGDCVEIRYILGYNPKKEKYSREDLFVYDLCCQKIFLEKEIETGIFILKYIRI